MNAEKFDRVKAVMDADEKSEKNIFSNAKEGTMYKFRGEDYQYVRKCGKLYMLLKVVGYEKTDLVGDLPVYGSCIFVTKTGLCVSFLSDMDYATPA